MLEKKVEKFKFIKKINNKILSLKQLNNGFSIKKQFIKKNNFLFSYKKFINNGFQQNFKKIIKFRIYNKNITQLCNLNNVILRYHGLILIDNNVLKESVENSWYDEKYFKNTNLLNYNVDKRLNYTCIVLSTGTNNLAHYLFESLTKLYYVKNNKEIKVIINEKIAKHILEILYAYGLRKNQILVKPINENWQIKKLIFPSVSYFEISKEESNFLSSIPQKFSFKNKKTHEKIYLSRRDATDSRNLINEIEIENFLKTEGYKIILLSKLNLKEKIRLLNDAKIIITPLGAGIQNVYFCKNIKAKVILIGTNRYFHQKYFLQLSYFKKMNLYFLQSTELTSYSRDYGFLHSSFFLDLNILKSALKKLKKV